jgi:hypothetical protein
MTTESFRLKQCWDTQRIGQIITKEATSVDTATFMATHTPLTKLDYQTSLQQITDMTEEGLFQELQRCADTNTHVFMTIQGIPGSGKSHLIRWLKERYETANSESECVIFIARAQCSLRSTLEQIITSGIFQKMMMQKQLEQLQNANRELSKEAFAEHLLNQFVVEGIEVSSQNQIRPPDWFNKEKLRAFIYDIPVREQLLKRDGPINRIVRFLTEGMGTERSSESPEFYESDFDFIRSSHNQIGGYLPAREVIKQLQVGKSRQALALYFNKLLPYVIGHATTLTTDNFKRIFLDLRRELHQKGSNLALFIEDITALTGVDLGLLDVLVTQHAGDINEDLCRVISVLGITDSYFQDHFPNHMEDRLTHNLTLNADRSTQNVSDTEFLSNEDVTAEMAARYLNAIRLHPEVIQQWAKSGSKPELLPIACDRCPVKVDCHQAFGYQRIVVNQDKELHIGLYPFNKTALWKFYQHIETAHKKTPRSFINSVIYYILQSHGEKIKSQGFPPAPTQLGGEFSTFSLEKSLQRNLIASQGGTDAKRIETLVTLWGDGTIDSYEKDQQLFVGTLPPTVFLAFGISPIIGEQLDASPPYQSEASFSSAATHVREHALAESSNTETTSPPTLFPQEEPETQQKYKLKLYRDDITTWLNGGRLQRYEMYNDLLGSAIHTFIDWDFYEVSGFQSEEALKKRRNIYLEDQSGQMKSTYYLTFQRSPELANILQALVEIKENQQYLGRAEWGAHISNISIWLHQNEEKVVNFVKQPNHESITALPLITVLILDCLFIVCLAGEIDITQSSSEALLRNLIRFCKETTISTWEKHQSASTKLRSASWASAMRQLKPTQVEKLCAILLRVLNCPQGGSSDVLFIDAATALNILEKFQLADWELPPSGCVGKPLQDLWKDALSIYNIFYDHFRSIVQEECQSVQEIIAQLDNFIGGDSVEEVFQAIAIMLQTLRDSQRGTNFVVNKALNANKLNALLVLLRDLVTEQNFVRLTLKLSQAEADVASANEYIDYFTNFERDAQLQKRKALQVYQKDFSQNVSQTRELVMTAYQEIIGELSKLTTKEDIS